MTRLIPRSLFARLMLANAAIILVTAIILPLTLSRMLSDTADSFVAQRLDREAEAFEQRQSDWPYDPGDRGHRVAEVDARGAIVRIGAYPLPFTLAQVRHSSRPEFDRHGRFDVYTRPVVMADGGRGWVIVAQDRTLPDEIVDDVVSSFLRRFAWAIGAALLAVFLCSFLVFRHVTGAFSLAATEADEIGRHRFDGRIDPARMPSEAVPLVRATNRALGRLEAAYRAQGEFVGNVAHELRTPLALISLRVEQLPASPQRDQIELGVAQANHVILQLMDLAAVDRFHPERAPVDPVDVARQAVESMAPIVYGADKSIAFDTPATAPPPILAVPELLAIAIRNLIDNAIRHTPPGTSIIVSVRPDGAIMVEDDGPGLAIDARDPDKRRFRRRDTARSDSAGLGLSIVERIMTACGGALEAGRSAHGGASLTLRPPLSDTASE